MKPRPSFRLPVTLALIGAALVLSHSPAHAQTAAPRTLTPVITSHEFVVDGEVIARDDTGFTVLSHGSELRTIRISRATTIKKGAETIHLADVRVGDKVNVTLRRGADGSLLAVDVAVRTGFEPRA